MKNLEFMGVQEMDAGEMRNENGGIFLPLDVWIATQICNFIAGFNDGNQPYTKK